MISKFLIFTVLQITATEKAFISKKNSQVNAKDLW